MSPSAITWRKSDSSTNGGDCVEVAIIPADDPSAAKHKAAGGGKELYVVRDSKDPDGPKLYFTDAEWAAFVEGAKLGEFDGPPSVGISKSADVPEVVSKP